MDRRVFFDAVRASVFRGRLSQTQVDGITCLLDTWEAGYAGPPAQLAYCLATSYHETAHTMQPVRETLANSDAQAVRRLDAAYAAGRLRVSRPYWREGWFGRGHVQLTHKVNYRKMGDLLGVDLASNPALALDPVISARVLFTGMIEGVFTGKPLDRYVGAARRDFRGARRVVNGTDRAGLVAGYAEAFLDALEAAPPAGYRPPDIGELTTGKPDAKSTTVWTTLVQSLLGSAAAILGALGDLTPWLAALIVAGALAAGLYIWHERRRKARELGI